MLIYDILIKIRLLSPVLLNYFSQSSGREWRENVCTELCVVFLYSCHTHSINSVSIIISITKY